MGVSEEEWEQLKNCKIPVGLDEVIQTGRQLATLHNPPMIHGFLKLTADVLERAGESALLAQLRQQSQQAFSTPMRKQDLEEQMRSGVVVLTEDLENELTGLAEEVDVVR